MLRYTTNIRFHPDVISNSKRYDTYLLYLVPVPVPVDENRRAALAFVGSFSFWQEHLQASTT